MIINLSSAILYVKDINKAKDFYIKVLGFKLGDDQGHFVRLKIGNDKDFLLALNSEHRNFQFPGKQTISIVSDNIELDYKNLESKGVKIFDKLASYSWGKFFSFEDLDGNHIDVVAK